MAFIRRSFPIFILVLCIGGAFWAMLWSTKALFFQIPKYEIPKEPGLEIKYPNPLPNFGVSNTEYLLKTISPDEVETFDECVVAGGIVVGLRTGRKECTLLDNRIFKNY